MEQIESRAEIRRKRRIKRRRRRKIIKTILLLFFIILIIIIICFLFYRKKEQKPYTIGLDAGHGGTDVGAIGYIEEVELTEKTVLVKMEKICPLQKEKKFY